MKLFVVALSIMVMAFNFPECSAKTVPRRSYTCCFRYVDKQIPRNSVTRYFETGGYCPQPGVVFAMKRGRKICANPQDAWVQDYMNDLKLNASRVLNNES